MTDNEFLAPVIKRNTGTNGQPLDPNLMRRMQHPICQACQLTYKKKYPGSPFEIECKGIAGEKDFQDTAKATGLPYERVREVMDRQYWSERHRWVTDDNGNLERFTARDYQIPVLQCTATHKVSRMGRGLGKTITGIFEELHIALTNKNYPILVVAPAKSQAKKWYDDILWQAIQDPDLSDSIISRAQQPFYLLRFSNGSTISIFTAGSTSGHGADAIRSQSPRRVRMEEQDGLNEDDYKVLEPLFHRYRNSEVHGAGTPTGARSMFWSMCRQFKNYKEFHVPITFHPDWSEGREATARVEARTEANFVHEYLAEFGDPEAGVFKTTFIDASRKPYLYSQQVPYRQELEGITPKRYFMGVDWNGEGTGTRIRIVEYDPANYHRRICAAQTIAGEKVTNWDTLDAIRDMNRKWQCEEIYLDYGYGAFQAGMLRTMGKESKDLRDKILERVHLVDFGASLKTNKLIPKRGRPKFVKLEEEKRMTKPFMVEGAVMCLERGLFEFSDKDDTLDLQLRAYRVKTWSQHGYANTYASGTIGDHDLDATMLALLAVEIKYGLLSETGPKHMPVVRHVPIVVQNDKPVRSREDSVTSRQPRQTPYQQTGRVVKMSRHSMIVVPGSAPGSAPPRSLIPSRTSRMSRPSPRRWL